MPAVTWPHPFIFSHVPLGGLQFSSVSSWSRIYPLNSPVPIDSNAGTANVSKRCLCGSCWGEQAGEGTKGSPANAACTSPVRARLSRGTATASWPWHMGSLIPSLRSSGRTQEEQEPSQNSSLRRFFLLPAQPTSRSSLCLCHLQLLCQQNCTIFAIFWCYSFPDSCSQTQRSFMFS